MYLGNMLFNLYNMPTTLEILLLPTSVFFFQDRPSSMIKPRKLHDSTRSMVIRFINMTIGMRIQGSNFDSINNDVIPDKNPQSKAVAPLSLIFAAVYM